MTTLIELIRRFNEAQAYVIAYLHERYRVPVGLTATDWVGFRMRLSAELQCDAHATIRPHGYGVSFKNEKLFIDFDFGEKGEATGFDAHRLMAFAERNAIAIPYATADDLKAAILDLVRCGQIRFSGYINYYLNDA